MARFEKGNKKGVKFKKGEQQTKIARKGGIKSQQVQHEKKLMKQLCEEKLLEILNNGKSCQENLIEKAKHLAFDNNTSLKEVLSFLIFLRDTSGQKPVDKIAQTDTEGNNLPPTFIIGSPDDDEPKQD